MARLVKVKDNHVGFIDIVETLLNEGTEQESRNGRTLEIQDLVIEVEDNSYAAPNGVRPGYQVEIGWVEGLQLIAGISDSAFTAQVQPNFRNYMEGDGKFWGAYGPRTVEQFPIITQRLITDNDTRQAVITIWNPELDAAGGKQDHPCTSLFNFTIRDGKLNMSVYMRSCDAWWGWAYDAVQFAMVHHTLANVIGVPVGVYTHHANSFHLYEPHWDEARKMVDNFVEPDEHPLVTPFFKRDARVVSWGNDAQSRKVNSAIAWDQARKRAFATYRVATQTLAPTELQTYDENLVALALLDRRKTVLDRAVLRMTHSD